MAYTLYDRLIQLCDALSLPSGVYQLEKRLVDVVLRRGTTDSTITAWKVFFKIQQEIETAIDRSIYSILPGVVENTFGFPPG